MVTAQSLWVPLKMSLGYTFELYNPGKADQWIFISRANGTHSRGQGKSLWSVAGASVNGTIVLEGGPSRMCQGTKNLSLTIRGKLYPGKCILCQPFDSLLLPPNMTKTCVTLPRRKEPISINFRWSR